MAVASVQVQNYVVLVALFVASHVLLLCWDGTLVDDLMESPFYEQHEELPEYLAGVLAVTKDGIRVTERAVKFPAYTLGKIVLNATCNGTIVNMKVDFGPNEKTQIRKSNNLMLNAYAGHLFMNETRGSYLTAMVDLVFLNTVPSKSMQNESDEDSAPMKLPCSISLSGVQLVRVMQQGDFKRVRRFQLVKLACGISFLVVTFVLTLAVLIFVQNDHKSSMTAPTYELYPLNRPRNS